MIHLRNRTGMLAGALTAASIALAATASFAMPRFDGLWSVSIVTQQGDCIASYRYPMRITNGILASGGDTAIDVRGRGRGRWFGVRHRQPRRHERRGPRPACGQRRQRILADRVLRRILDRRAAQPVIPPRQTIKKVTAGPRRPKRRASRACARPSTPMRDLKTQMPGHGRAKHAVLRTAMAGHDVAKNYAARLSLRGIVIVVLGFFAGENLLGDEA
jgi:hypothetical protein